MRIERLGRGPDLILLHGWAMHGGIFAPLVDSLAARCTLHLVDLPGHGASAADERRLVLADTVSFLVRRLPGAIWLGWSLGGLFCLEAARSHAARVRALVLIAATPCFVAQPDWPHGVPRAVFEDFGRDLARDYRGTLDRFLALECQGSDCARSDLRTLREHLFDHGEPAASALEDGLALLADTDLRAALPTIACPALWLAGGRDRLVPEGALAWGASRMPHARHVRIAGGGHAPFIGHPDRVLAELLPYIDEVLA